MKKSNLGSKYRSLYQKKLKRILDIEIALVMSVFAFPVFIIIAVWIKLDSRGPVLFLQKRVGRNKRYFNIYKFRTMKLETPSNCPTHRLENPDVYITKAGKFLRKTSLDELPQIFNILRGDMSFVGPRPALWNQYDLIKKRDRYNANNIMPGLTGWAQIHGRDELEIEEKAKLDGIYAKNQSFRLDSYCFIKTIVSVLHQEGVKEGKN